MLNKMPSPEDAQHAAQAQRNFRASVSAWRKCANHLESLLADSEDIKSLKQGRDELTKAMNHLEQMQDKLEDLDSPDPSATELYETANQENYQLIKKTCRRIFQLGTEGDDTKSTVSSRSRGSRQSASSTRSSVPDRATIATEAAAIRAKLKFADLEARKRAELELKMAEVEKMNSLKELHVAEATLEAIDREQHEYFETSRLTEVPAQMGADAYVEAYLKSNANADFGNQEFPSNPNKAKTSANMEGSPAAPKPNPVAMDFPTPFSTLNPFSTLR